MVAIEGLYETHLTVTDLERSIGFYTEIVGLELAHRVPVRGAAFLWIAGRERSMLGLWSIGSSPLRMRLHLAFRCTLAEVCAAPAGLRAKGVRPLDSGGGQEIDEPIVYPWMPAAAVFFDDPDGHSLEYIALLDDAPRPEVGGIMSLSAWRSMGRT